MKKIRNYLIVILAVLSFTQCTPKIESPDASYKYYVLRNGVLVENPDSITNKESIIFKSLNLDGADYYSVFIGDYKIGTNTGDNLTKTEDSLCFYLTRNAKTELGTFKIYMVATNVNLSDGKIKKTIDSSRTITVFDPTLSQAIISTFEISQAGKTVNGPTSKSLSFKNVNNVTIKVGFPVTSTITADSIIFNDVNPNYYPIFRSSIFKIDATSSDIYINDSTHQDTYAPLSTNTAVGNYIFKNGCKIKIISKDGTSTKIYPIRISYLKL